MTVRRALRDQRRLMECEERSFHILELLRQRGPLTRTELSQGTGYNIVTVSNYLQHFITQGLVSERGLDVSTGGRKPVLVELNAKAGFVVGVDLGPMGIVSAQTVIVLTDLKGQIVHRLVKASPSGHVDRRLHEIAALLRELLSSSPVDPAKILGIGIGLPGLVDERSGTVRDTSPRGIRTSYVAVRDQLEEEFRRPVFMGSDATLAGYGELRLGLDRPVDNLVYFYSEVGASLILNGQIYWGSGGSAGQLGLFVSSDDDYLSWINSPQFLISRTWDLGLAAHAKKLVAEGHPTALHDVIDREPERVTLTSVLQTALDGDQLACELIEHAAMQLGIRIAYLINVLNPEVVVIGGGIERAGSLLLEPVWRTVKKYAYEGPANLVDVLPGQLGENAVALGASCWMIREIFTQA